MKFLKYILSIISIPFIKSLEYQENLCIDYCDIFTKDINNFQVSIKDDKISFTGDIDNYYQNYLIGIQKYYDNYKKTDLILINNQITSYTLFKPLYCTYENYYLVLPKESKYLLEKKLIKKDNITTFYFSRYLNTQNLNDTIINYNINNYIFYEKLNNIDLFYNPKPEESFNLIILKNDEPNTNYQSIFEEYIFMIGYYSVFLLCIISHLLLNKYSIKNYTINLRYFGIFSIGSFIFLFSYTLWWLIFCIYTFLTEYSNEILSRQGFWLNLNFITVLLPITRHSVWLYLLNLPHNQIVFIHKYTAFLCLLSVIIKLLSVICCYDTQFLFKINSDDGGNHLAGTLSSIFVILSSVISNNIIRKKFFELFYYSHKILALLIIITASLHYIIVLYYILPAIILYIVDIFLRYKNTYKANYSHLQIIGEEKNNTSCILIYVELLQKIKINPGSYFFICFENISTTEWHPLSIMLETNGNLLFCAKDMGKNTWTHKLKEYDYSINKKGSILDNRKIYIQGPYGHISVDYKNYENIICVAGGIGITPIINVLQDIDYNKYQKIKKVYLIWVITNSSLIKPFNFILEKLNKNLVEIQIYCTNKNDIEDVELDIKYEKPNISNVMHSYLQDNCIENINTCVLCCGPTSLSNDVIKTCSRVNITYSNENF
jgi:NAD(P)H-flavin reductase